MENEKTNKLPEYKDISFLKFGAQKGAGQLQAEEKFGRNKWIDYGKDNAYYQELVRLYNNADGLHKRLIDSKAEYIAGAGFKPVAALEEFIANEFSEDTLDSIALDSARDLVLFNGYYLKVIFNDKGEIAQVDHYPLEKVRIEKPHEEDGSITGFYTSVDWENYKRKENTPQWISAFDPENYKEFPEQLLYVRIKSKGVDYYTIPTYSPDINWLRLSAEISLYHLRNAENGMVPKMIVINKRGIPTPEQRDKEYEAFTSRYGGSDKVSDTIMVYAESAEKAPEFITMEPNTTDEQFKDLMIQISNNIMRTHKFTSAIAGIEVSGKLGSKNEIEEQLEMFQLTVINPLQKIVDDSFNKLARTNSLQEEMELLEFRVFKEIEDIKEEIVDIAAQGHATMKSTVGGVGAAIDMAIKVSKGELPRESAIAMLGEFYGMPREKADAMIPQEKPTAVEELRTKIKTK